MVQELTWKIVKYENDMLSEEDTIKLFAELVRSGAAWKLQGHYGRMAQHLIEEGLISREGEIL